MCHCDQHNASALRQNCYVLHLGRRGDAAHPQAQAKRSYGGNVSALVSAIAKEAKRQAALDWLLQKSGATPMTDAERNALLAEVDGKPTPKKRRGRAA
jgi:post-segregation antitoxin (ccd killing protein)